MKKIITGLFVTVGFSINAQNHFSVGAHIGIPVMDVADASSINVGLNAAYLHDISENFKIGASMGYSHFFVKTLGTDLSFIPIAAKAQYVFPKSKFFIDLDLGYAFSGNSSFTGGLYAYPKVGYKISKGELYVGFQSFSNKYKFDYYDVSTANITNNANSSFSAGSVNIGYNFSFK